MDGCGSAPAHQAAPARRIKACLTSSVQVVSRRYDSLDAQSIPLLLSMIITSLAYAIKLVSTN
eukprot:329358-Prorocentrum_minimum.AAC.3